MRLHFRSKLENQKLPFDRPEAGITSRRVAILCAGNPDPLAQHNKQSSSPVVDPAKWCIMAAAAAPAVAIRMLAPRRGVVPTSVAPVLAGRRFLRLLGSRDRLQGPPCRRCRSRRG